MTFPTGNFFYRKLECGNITMKSFEEGLKLRSLEMLAHREMEDPDFSFTQECSNDRVPS